MCTMNVSKPKSRRGVCSHEFRACEPRALIFLVFLSTTNPSSCHFPERTAHDLEASHMAALRRQTFVPAACARRLTKTRTTRTSTLAGTSTVAASSADCFFQFEGGALRHTPTPRVVNSSHALEGYERALALWRHGSVHAAIEAFGESHSYFRRP